mgnify:FL=1
MYTAIRYALTVALSLAMLSAGARNSHDTPIGRGLHTITQEAAKAHVAFLAHDLLEGRRAGERGSQIAQLYLQTQMSLLGIGPLLPSGYRQPFTAIGSPRLHRVPRYFVEPDSVDSLRRLPHCQLPMANVLGVLPGTQPDEYVVVGAHLDHEGMDPQLSGDKIYNGADDNASGLSAVLQIMKALATAGQQPRRTIIFAFWDGEEFGLLGSRYFVSHFQAMDKVRGYLNFDMVGGNHLPDDPWHVVYFYSANHPRFGQWLRSDVQRYQLSLHPDYRAWDNPVGGSDQGSFARHGVPIIWYHTDGQPHYNQPSDEAQTLNYAKLADITRAAYLTVWHLANDEL